MNQHNSPSAARLMETLNNLFYLMVGLSLVAFVWVYLNLPAINPNIIFSVPAYRPYLHGLFLLSSLAVLIRALVQYRKSIKDPAAFSGPENNTKEKVMAKVSFFRAAALKMYLLLTLSTLIVVAGFYLSAKPEYAAAYSVLLIVFSLFRPTPERMMKEMKMKKEERDFFYEAARQDRMEQENK